MKHILLMVVLTVWCGCLPAAAETLGKQAVKPAVRDKLPTAVSIVPARVEPGGTLVITLASAIPDISVQLGGNTVAAVLQDDRTVLVKVPATLQPGQYVLTLRAGGSASRSYSVTILSLKPEALSLEPDRITRCFSQGNSTVTLRGRHFSELSRLLFNGAIIRSRYQGPEEISFDPPPVAGGLHQVAVKNGDAVSQPVGLMVVTEPLLHTVSIGADQVNRYELIIEGDNFQQNSVVLVDGARVGASGADPAERLIFVDCTRLIYQRRPTTSTPRELRLQVANPSGGASRTEIVVAP